MRGVPAWSTLATPVPARKKMDNGAWVPQLDIAASPAKEKTKDTGDVEPRSSVASCRNMLLIASRLSLLIETDEDGGGAGTPSGA